MKYLIFMSSFTEREWEVYMDHSRLTWSWKSSRFPGSNTAAACGEQLMETQQFAGDRENVESEQWPVGTPHSRDFPRS